MNVFSSEAREYFNVQRFDPRVPSRGWSDFAVEYPTHALVMKRIDVLVEAYPEFLFRPVRVINTTIVLEIET